MSEQIWTKPENRLPDKGSRVKWMSPSGQVVTGHYEGVWLRDNGMYVYYRPVFWQPCDA